MEDKNKRNGSKAPFKNYIVNKRISDYLDSKAQETSPKFAVKSFADAIGVTPENVRQWRNGYSRPDIDKLISISTTMECSLDFLLGRTDIMNNKHADMIDELNLTIEAIGNLKDMKSIDHKNKYNFKTSQKIPEDFSYGSIISYFLCKRELWDTIQEQLMNIDKFNNDENYKKIYLELSNKKQKYMPAKDFASMNISNEITNILNDYMSKKY